MKANERGVEGAISVVKANLRLAIPRKAVRLMMARLESFCGVSCGRSGPHLIWEHKPQQKTEFIIR